MDISNGTPEVFEDTSVITTTIKTVENQWDSDAEVYVPRNTEYFLENCEDYYYEALQETIIIDT